MVKVGDKVIVNGIEATVQQSYAAGAHRSFVLSDGRSIVDLDKLVASGKASVVAASAKPVAPVVKEDKTVRKWDWLPKDGQHDLEE